MQRPQSTRSDAAHVQMSSSDVRALVLFCGDPLRSTAGGIVYPSFDAEAAAAKRNGFALALLDFEALAT
jgi:uridine phosphorylase